MKPTNPPHGASGHHHAPEELINEDVAHEESDVNVRAILGFAFGVAAVAVVCAVAMIGLFYVFEQQAAAADPHQSPLAAPASTMPKTTVGSPYFGTAAKPQLLTNEPAALRQLRQTEDQTLHQYGWANQSAGVARVPIDEAKKLILERGLPSRATAVDAQLGTHAPAYGEAAGGRRIPTGAGAPAATPQEPAATAPEVKQPPAGPPAHGPGDHKGGAE